MNRLQEWKEKLLDTSKKNRLINFKFTKDGPIELVYPDTLSIYNKLINDKSVYLFDPLQKSKNLISKEELLEKYSKDTPKNSILMHSETKVPTLRMKTILKEVKEFLDEKGINILFVTIGLLEYKDTKDDSTLLSPLLLLPIKVSFDSNESKYEIEVLDDPLDNITLKKKLRDDFKINLPVFNKKKGIERFFKDCSKLSKKYDFKLIESTYISTLSYYKINIFEDLTKNERAVLKNKNIKLLISDEKITIKDGEYNGSKLENVVLADSSQNEAVKLSSSGKSFVLEGPPGAGKSQTITNIISKALFDNKKVLFVSEKAAALNIVEDNLTKANLGDYILNMHSSSKKDKQSIINNIYDSLIAPKVIISRDIDRTLNDYQDVINKINQYNDNLFSLKRDEDLSMYSYTLNAAKYYKAIDVKYEIEDIQNKKKSFLDNINELLTKYLNITETIGIDYRLNPFYGLIKTEFRYNEVDELYTFIKEYLETINKLIDLSFEIDKETGIEPFDYFSLTHTIHLFEKLSKYDIFFKSLFDLNQDFYQKIVDLKKSLKEEKEAHDFVSTYYGDYIYDTNEFSFDLILKSKSLFDRLKSNYKLVVKDLNLHAYKKPSYKKLCEVIDNVRTYKKLRELNDLSLSQIAPLIKDYYKERDTDFGLIINMLDDIKPYILESLNYEKIASLSSSTIKDLYSKYEKKANSLIKNQEKCEKQLSPSFDYKIVNFNNFNYKDLKEKIKSIFDNYSSILHYTDFLKLKYSLDKANITDYIDKFLDTKGRNISDLIPSYNKIYYNEMIHYQVSHDELIKNTNNIEIQKRYDTFDELDQKILDINKAEIISICSKNKPSSEVITNGSPLSIIQKEAEKKRFQMPVRLLMSKCAPVIQKIKPCFLMSPLSVSTYFIDAPNIKFDMVIFDEASQIVPEDSLAPIFRADQIIVVGDSKQMPPTSFFQSQIQESIDEYDEENVLSYESLLDFCSSRFKSSRLNYHYRSRFEDLISFSNEYIYKKSSTKLVTFPSAQIKQDFLGIDFYKVEKGYFDSVTRSNKEEAKKVVELIKRNIELYPSRSLGVIAFGIGQQKAILDMVLKEAEKDKDLRDFINKESDEPFFIRNLENVQGNERDTIILSVAYSKDKNGPLKYSFGPINSKGGERRLNVAFTRAKYNIMVVSSIEASDFTQAINSEGVMLLKNYLRFAKDNEFEDTLEEKIEDNNVVKLVDTHNYIKDEIKDFLVSSGYDIVENVGSSDYPVDLAIRSIDDNRYVLAIDVDSYKFYNIKDVRDYSIRRQMLNKLGWHYYKVNAIEWSINKEGEKKILLSKISEAFEGIETVNKYTKSGLDILTTIENEPFKEYIKANYTKLLKEYKKTNNFSNLIHEVLSLEEPISKLVLLRNILPIFNSETLSAKVKEGFNTKLDLVKGIKEVDEFLFTKYQKIYPLRVIKDEYRDINTISKEEIAGGIYKIISLNQEASEKGIIDSLAKAINCKRVTKNVEGRIMLSIKHLVKNGYIKAKDDIYSIKKEIKE